VSRASRCLLVLALLLSPAIASAQSLNVDIGAVGGTPSNGFGAAAGQAGTWNEIGLGLTSNLAGLSGAGTGVSVAVAADTDTGSELTCAGDIGALINDNIYRLGANAVWNVTFTGLANGPYTVYLYGPVNTAVNTGTMNVNGASVPNISGDACTLTGGVTFQAVQTTVTNNTLALSGDETGTGGVFAGLAGVQLVAAADVPAMPVWMMSGVGFFVTLGGALIVRAKR
jgi:hypothetical protein